MRTLACALAILAACGDPASVTPDAAPPDASPDASDCAGPRTPDPDATFEMLLKQIEQNMAMQQIPGLAFAVLDHGVTRTVALGKRQAGACQAFTAQTRIRLGRPTRTLVSLATLIAVAEGKLSLDDAVVAHLPGFHVTNGTTSDIKVRHLLDHSAGLYVDGFMNQCPSQDLTGYWSTVDAKLEFTPGTAIANFDEELSLLGAVLAHAYGKPYRTVIAEKIFAPLGMTATFDHDEFLLGPHAFGGKQLNDPPPCTVWEPVHQVYTSLDDLVALTKFLNGSAPGTLPIDPAFVRNTDTPPGKPFHEKEFATGYGLDSFPYTADGTREYFSDGDIASYGGEIDVFPSGFSLALVTNTGACTYCITDLMVAALSPYVFHDWLAPLPKSRWSEYVGTWQDDLSNPPRTLAITYDAVTGTLNGTYNGLSNEMPAFGEDTFNLLLFGMFDRFRFWRDAQGTPQLLTTQFGKLGPAFHRVP